MHTGVGYDMQASYEHHMTVISMTKYTQTPDDEDSNAAKSNANDHKKQEQQQHMSGRRLASARALR